MPRKKEPKFKGSGADEELLKRKILFTPCKDMQALHDWIHLFLGIDFPMVALDVENGCVAPMTAIWDVYSHSVKNNDYDYRRVLFMAARDSGKCVVKGSKIIDKNKGIVNIEEVKIGDIVWSGRNWRKVTDWIHDGIKPGYRATLKNGIEITGSIIHRVWAWSPNASRPDWKKVSELTTDDFVCTDTSSDFYSTKINQEEYDKGYICGILQGDGCLTQMSGNKNTIYFSNMDPFVLKFFNDYVYKIAGEYPKSKNDPKRAADWRICSKIFKDHVLSLGLKCCAAQEKEIPSFCYTSNSAMSGFVSGMLDTDGTINNKNCILLEITAEKLQKQLLVVLHAMGINAALYKKPTIPKLGNYYVWQIRINQTDIPTFHRAGMKVSAKKAIDLYSLATPKIPDAHDTIPLAQVRELFDLLKRTKPEGIKRKDRVGLKPKIPNGYPSISRDKLMSVLDWTDNNGLLDPGVISYWKSQLKNKWHKVIEVGLDGEKDFYDLTVEVDHCYWSNGTINHNTLAAACLELLQMFHCRRDIVHLAAIEQQSQKSFEYLKGFLGKFIIKDFLKTAKARLVEIIRFKHKVTGENIPLDDWNFLPEDQKEDYEKIENYIKLLVLTAQSTNGDHCSFKINDETDLIEGDRKRAYEESKLILGVDQRGNLPISLDISTRKSMTGLVQQEIDNSAKTGLVVHKWNILDITEECPPERHLPEEPRIPIYRSDDLLSAMSEKDYNNLGPDLQSKYVADTGFAGCLSNCQLFSSCLGRLATVKRPHSTFYKKIGAVQGLFRDVSLETAQAQLLCRRPAKTGLIYSKLDENVHIKSASTIASMITGHQEVMYANYTKQDLVNLAIDHGLTFASGMDFGYDHNFAVVTAIRDGNRIFIIDTIAASELEITQKLDICNRRIKELQPIIFADPEDPSSIVTFRKNGYHMRQLKKGAGSILAGIDMVRQKLNPLIGKPHIYFMDGDDGVRYLFDRMSRYQWKLDATGNPTSAPDMRNDDECFTGDTEALTDSGWKSLADITINDKIMGVDEFGNGEFDFPLNVIHKKYSGEMHTIKQRNLEFTATKNHQHAIMTQMNHKVNKLFFLDKSKQEELCSESYWANNLKSWKEGPSSVFEGKENEAWMAGFWVAEGCFDTGRPTYLIYDQTKKPQKDKFRETATALGWKWSETKSKGKESEHVRFVVSGQGTRAAIWRQWFGSGARNKKISKDILFKMKNSEKEAFLQGYLVGDGSLSHRGQWFFSTISENLADDLQILIMSLGYGCNINKHLGGSPFVSPVNGKAYVRSDLYRGSIRKANPVAHIAKNSFVKQIVKEIDVHCVTMKTGFFLARTNKRTFIAGNCDAIRYLVMGLFPVAKGHHDNAASNIAPKAKSKEQEDQEYYSDFFRSIIEERTANGPEVQEEDPLEAPRSGPNGTSRWSF